MVPFDHSIIYTFRWDTGNYDKKMATGECIANKEKLFQASTFHWNFRFLIAKIQPCVKHCHAFSQICFPFWFFFETIFVFDPLFHFVEKSPRQLVRTQVVVRTSSQGQRPAKQTKPDRWTQIHSTWLPGKTAKRGNMNLRNGRATCQSSILCHRC